MQTTSALWKQLWAGGNARLETVAEIGGVDYTAISAPVIQRALMQDGLSVGNAVSASCRLTVRTADALPRSASVVVRMRLTDGTQASEWLHAGTFYISHRSRDAVTGLTTLECYDALLKGNATYEPGGVWPRSMAAVAAEIAAALGLQMDARNVLATGSAYMLDEPETGSTVNDVLKAIAAANGANWIVTPAGRLRLVPLVSADDAQGATEDVIGVLGVTGSASASAAGTVTGVRCDDDGEACLVGDETGLVIDAGVTPAVALDLAGRMVGLTYQAYELAGAIYDPAAELGDYVNRLNDVHSVLCRETARLGLAFRGDIGAPEPGELTDEYPYVGGSKKALQIAKAYAQKCTETLEESLDQQEIFNRLTNDGAVQGLVLANGQLYINASYINTGLLNANLIRAGMISDATGDNYWVLDGANRELVAQKGTIGNFTLENGSLQYGSMAQGGRGAYVGSDGIAYNYTWTGTQNTTKVSVFGQGLRFYWDDELKTMLFMYEDGISVRTYDPDGTYYHPFKVMDQWNSFFPNGCKLIYLGYETRVLEDLVVSKNATVNQSAEICGDLVVHGTKNRQVDAGQYGQRLMYSYETPSPLFGDVGEGVIGEDGKCHVWLDAVFAGIVSDGQYQVFLQRYGPGDCRVAERRGGCFVVEGEPGLRFGWEIKARQRDYDQLRLERAAERVELGTADFGQRALQYIERLKDRRISA